MYKRRLLTLFLSLFAALCVSAQDEVTVKTFKELSSDLSARTNRRYDMSDIPCALIKVYYPQPGASFESSMIVGDVEYKNGAYWVYMASGAKRLKVLLPDNPSISVEFSNYDINKLEQNVTYVIEFKFPRAAGMKTSFYAEAGFVAGGMMGAELAVGTYLGGFNVELNAMLPFTGGQSLYWYDKNGTPIGKAGVPVAYTYKPSLAFGARLGYGIMAGDKFRITPQLGFQLMKLSEKAASAADRTPAKGANCGSLTVDVKLQYKITKTLGVSLTPIFALPIAKSNGFKALTDASSSIGKWNKGVGVKAAVSFEF